MKINSIHTPTDSCSRISTFDVDQVIETALVSISRSLQTSPEEALAAHTDALAATGRLWTWVDERLTTTEGVQLTRDEFRRRLESERARHAGEAERRRLTESCERLERWVLGNGLSPLLEGSIEPSSTSIY